MKRTLRICMVHYSDYHLDSRIQRQARALAERGDEVHCVCLSVPGREAVGAGSIHLHPVACEKERGGESAYVRGYARFFAGALRQVTALALRRRLDLVEAHNMPDFLTLAGLLPKLRGTPIILNCHDTFPELFATKFARDHSDRAVRLVYLEERLSAGFADHVITVTEEARQRLISRGIGKGCSSVVMNSPDEGVFGPAREAAAPPEDGLVRVLYHGGLAPRFGVETLIRAFALAFDREPRLRLRVCGVGEDRDRLAALAAELAPGVIDVPEQPVPFARIPAELERAHIGVVPTLHDSFTELLLPVKLLEYVHMGLPALSSRLPAIERYFGDDDVWFCEPGDAQSFADTLVTVCRNPAAARERAARASALMRDLAWQSQSERYLRLVDELAGRPRLAAQKSAAAAAVPST